MPTLLQFLSSAVVFAGLVYIFHLKDVSQWSKLIAASCWVVGAALITHGLHRLGGGDIAAEGSSWKYGPQAWYQNIVAGFILTASGAFSLVVRAKDSGTRRH